MVEQDEQQFLDEYEREIKQFFKEKLPGKRHVLNCYRRGGFVADANSILNYLQTAFLDEQICEVVIEGFTRTYLCKIWDAEPDIVEQVDESGTIIQVESEYSPGEYLRAKDKLFISPLESGLGNFHVVFCNKLVLRIFIGNKTVELGVHFVKRNFERDIPCLQFSFPKIGLLSSGDRVYRAKVPANIEIAVSLQIKKKRGKTFQTRPQDISAEGISLIIKKKHLEFMEVDDKRRIMISIPGLEPFQVTCSICHLSKVREKRVIQYLCGLKFDLESRAMAKKVEGIVAMVQREYLKNLAAKSEELGIDLKY